MDLLLEACSHSANCAEDWQDPTGAVLGLVGIPVVVQRQVLRFDSAENCGISAVAVLSRWSTQVSWGGEVVAGSLIPR